MSQGPAGWGAVGEREERPRTRHREVLHSDDSDAGTRIFSQPLNDFSVLALRERMNAKLDSPEVHK